MHKWWISGVLTVLLAQSSSAIVERTLDLFPDSVWSLNHEPEHNALSLPTTGPKNRLRTLRLFDDRGTREGGQSRIDPSYSLRQPDREMEEDEVDQPAAKRRQLHLDLTLGPAAWARGAASPPGSSNSQSPIRQHSGSSHPIYRISEDNDSNHAFEQPSQAGDSAPYNEGKAVALEAHRGAHGDKLKKIDASEIPVAKSADKFRTANRDLSVSQTMPASGESSSTRSFDSEVKFESWAWLSIILTDSRRSIDGESKAKYIKPETRRLFDAYFTHHMRRGKKTEEEIYEDQHMKTRLSKITELLWISNHQIVKNLCTSGSGSRYIEEQTELQEWFLEFLLRCRRYMITPPTEESDDEGRIHQQMTNAIRAKVEITAYQIYRNGSTKKPILLTKPQMLMNKSVFDILGYYYKSMSKERWNSIKSLEGVNNGSLRIESQCWSAWKAFSSQESLKSIPFFSDLAQAHQFVYHAKPIYDEMNIGEMEKLKIVTDFDADNSSDQKWAWIARVKLNKKSVFEKLFQPTTDTIMDEVRTYLIEIAGKDLNAERKARLEKISIKEIYQKLDQIFDILWGLNEKLLDIFDCEFHGEEYISGQKSVQVFLLSCFSDRAKVQQSTTILENIPDKQAPPKDIIKEGIVNLLVDMLILEKNEPRFTCPATRDSTNLAILHEEDLILGQIVVNILGNYYKNKNHSKYLFHFGRDKWFFNFIISRGTNIFHKSRSYNDGRYEDYKRFKSFPWENQIDENMPRRLHKLGSRIVLDLEKWIKPVKNSS
ncbi:hypothetical protein PSHT_13792 [Puccinia striiformis]|uniref:Uncharacterized protein n=1 Tax=Puccinia striiformis TaxID=27350 RepID=A0A2S4UP21_9BASI|nr:hypothetical protein PSHT_13792 [Puccinia striiformis]